MQDTLLPEGLLVLTFWPLTRKLIKEKLTLRSRRLERSGGEIFPPYIY